MDKLRAGELSEGDFAAFERTVMGTAPTMAVFCEALSVSLSAAAVSLRSIAGGRTMRARLAAAASRSPPFNRGERVDVSEF